MAGGRAEVLIPSPEVRLIELPENVGFGSAVNAGARSSRATELPVPGDFRRVPLARMGLAESLAAKLARRRPASP